MVSCSTKYWFKSSKRNFWKNGIYGLKKEYVDSTISEIIKEKDLFSMNEDNSVFLN